MMFDAFRSRITRGYVLLAVVLIVVIVAASSALAFLLFARSMNDAIANASQRVQETAAQVMASHTSLQQAAPEIASRIGRHVFHVVVIDASGHRLAQNEREGEPGAGRSLVIAIGRAIGLPRARIPVNGGAVLISPDIDRFGSLLFWYWSIMAPIGILAVLIAWWFGRRITARAVGPLADVTSALRVIAAGDFSPRRLLEGSSEMRELTGAYNDVAYSLATATAERARTEAQMRQFIADAGHELRTPLTIIMGYLDVLRRGIVDPSGAQPTYETMLDESRKMRALIDKLILLARLERAPSAPPDVVDLGDIAQRAVTSLAPIANGRVRFERSDGAQCVLANASELQEAIKNVIDNALKYATESDVDVAVGGDADGAWVEVADRGPGMEAQDAAHAFDRFYRGAGRGQAEGTGLGLAIAKTAAERAGGTVRLESAPGEGTRVQLRLPRSEKPAPSA